jgi:hypothetical protein
MTILVFIRLVLFPADFNASEVLLSLSLPKMSSFERKRAENRKHGSGKENLGLLSLTSISGQVIELWVHT